MDYREIYRQWRESPDFDEETKRELAQIQDNEKEIEDRFYKDLTFGTGGLRGVIGAGTNRMNVYTVRRATQGLANFIIRENGQDRGVAIAFDSRHMSPEFAREAALCLNANGIKTYRFDTLRPTPELSFAVRTLGCIAGIAITASHNPPEYNGYKVYWEDGAQVTAPMDRRIIEEVGRVRDYGAAKTMSEAAAVAAGLYHTIGSEIDDKYIEALKRQIIHPEIIAGAAEDLRIVYTPLHGTGNLPVRRVLAELGFKHVYVVPEQAQPDGDFPTVSYPNPEDPEAFRLALALARAVDADIVLATDPDADRLGVYAKDLESGEYISFTGNMSGILIAEYILRERRACGTLPENGALIRTIVTTKMADALAKDYHVDLIEVLTGFKYIGEQIRIFEQQRSHEYIFGLEESYGCLVGTHARDKDAVAAVMALCEVASWCKLSGRTLWSHMLELYEKYGYYKEGLESITLKGVDGTAKIEAMMERIRSCPPRRFGSQKALVLRDYQCSKAVSLEDGEESALTLPKSNVLYFELENDGWCCARPSGTEPKIKFYMGVRGTSLADASEKLDELTAAVMALAAE